MFIGEKIKPVCSPFLYKEIALVRVDVDTNKQMMSV